MISEEEFQQALVALHPTHAILVAATLAGLGLRQVSELREQVVNLRMERYKDGFICVVCQTEADATQPVFGILPAKWHLTTFSSKLIGPRQAQYERLSRRLFSTVKSENFVASFL
jgi:hypothetical protein